MDHIMILPDPETTSSNLELPLPRKRRPWRSILLGLIILFCGILIGAGVTVILLQRVVFYAIHHPEEIPNRLTERLRNKLSLTDDQTKKVKAILTERQKAFTELRHVTRPKVERELKSLEKRWRLFLIRTRLVNGVNGSIGSGGNGCHRRRKMIIDAGLGYILPVYAICHGRLESPAHKTEIDTSYLICGSSLKNLIIPKPGNDI